MIASDHTCFFGAKRIWWWGCRVSALMSTKGMGCEKRSGSIVLSTQTVATLIMCQGQYFRRLWFRVPCNRKRGNATPPQMHYAPAAPRLIQLQLQLNRPLQQPNAVVNPTTPAMANRHCENSRRPWESWESSGSQNRESQGIWICKSSVGPLGTSAHQAVKISIFPSKCK